MSNLDQFFKDKFQDREFEFQESYWEGARELIVEEDKRRRRGLLWRNLGFGVLLLMLIGAGAGMYWWTNNNDPVGGALEMAEANAKEDLPDSATNALNDNGEKNSQTSTIISPLKKSNDTESNPELATTNAVRSNTNTNTNTSNTRTFPANDKLVENPQKEESKSIIENKNPKASESSKQNADTTATATSTPVANSLETPPASEAASAPRASLAHFAHLNPLPISPLHAAEEPLSTSIKDPQIRQNKWRLGLAVFSQFYPGREQEAFWLGGAVGPSLGYALNDQWTLQADLLYQMRRGNFASAAVESDKTFTFGLRETRNILQPTALHYLELPLYLKWRNRRQMIEGGLFLTYLTGVRGEWEQRKYLHPWELRSLLQPSDRTVDYTSEIIEKGWVESNTFSQWRPGLLLGYRYWIASSFSANFRVKYHLNNISSDANVEVVNESGPVEISLGFTCYPFRSLRK